LVDKNNMIYDPKEKKFVADVPAENSAQDSGSDEVFVAPKLKFVIRKKVVSWPKLNFNDYIKPTRKFDIRNFILTEPRKSSLPEISKNTYIHGKRKYRHVFETDQSDIQAGMNILQIKRNHF